jgi:putative hydroxymethylpyrimidine transporter CytX
LNFICGICPVGVSRKFFLGVSRLGEKKTSLRDNSMIWFGAAIGLGEILAGTLIAPLGFTRGVTAIIIGHVIGCILLYYAGIIGGRTGKSAMETVRISFGNKGSNFFALLNVLQLVGWTAVMVLSGARATGVLANPVLGFHGDAMWCVLIGALIILWLLIGVQNLGKINIIAVGGLFLLTILLSTVVFRGGSAGETSGVMSFGAAVELSAAMPISWLPLISDYTRFAEKPKAATMASTVSYFIGSCWMYIIGLGAAIFFSESDIAVIMLQAGMGITGVLIIILSTVTTTFLDAYSAGVSTHTIAEKLSEKWVAVVVCIIGTVLAMFTPIAHYENFLYFIGSVFAPMIAILITDFFLIKEDHSQERLNTINFILWLIGFLVYRQFMSFDLIIGSTFPVMFITGLLCILVHGGKKLCLKKSWTM